MGLGGLEVGAGGWCCLAPDPAVPSSPNAWLLSHLSSAGASAGKITAIRELLREPKVHVVTHYTTPRSTVGSGEQRYV